MKLPRFPVEKLRFHVTNESDGPHMHMTVDYYSWAYVKFAWLIGFSATREFRSLTIGVQTFWSLVKPIVTGA